MIGANAEAMKGIFDELLKSELRGSRYQVEASYVMARAPFLMDFVVRGKVLRMRINLSLFWELQKACDMPQAWKAYYCIFYMANYVKALGEARQGIARGLTVNMAGITTYAEGLARLEAYFHGEACGNCRVHSLLLMELTKRRQRSLGCLDILCEVNALIRSKAFLFEQLTAGQKSWLDGLIEERMLYLGLPEVVYGRRGWCQSALRRMLISLRDFMGKQKGIPKRGSAQDGDMIAEILSGASGKDGREEKKFWVELLMRLCVCSPKVFATIGDEELQWAIRESAAGYGKNAAEFYDKLVGATAQEGHAEPTSREKDRRMGLTLLQDDFLVIRKMNQRVLSWLGDGEENLGGGRIHAAY